MNNKLDSSWSKKSSDRDLITSDLSKEWDKIGISEAYVEGVFSNHKLVFHVEINKGPDLKNIYLENGLLHRGLSNLLKKVHYLNLNLNLEQGFITEEEFEEELNNNLDSYLIHTDMIQGEEELFVLGDILKKHVNQIKTVSDAAEIFGSNTDELEL